MKSEPTPNCQGKILIVDDNPTNLKVICDFLAEAGFNILIARHGERALQIVENVHPDLILLDVMMPGIDGFETCTRLKANPLTYDIPVIFMTARSDQVDKIKGLDLGAVDYITKPFQLEEVLAHVRVHLKLRNLTKLLQEQNSLLQQEVQERRLVQDALQQSEQKYRVLVETSQDIIFSCDTQGRFTFVNQAVRKIHGYEPEEMIGRSFTDFVSVEQLSQDQEVFQRILEGEPFFKYETIHIAKTGRRINLLFNAIVAQDAQGNILGITGTASDITERKRAELALRESEERYRRIIETSYEGVWMIDAEGKTSFVNTRMAQMLGYTVEEMLGKPIFGFMDEEGIAMATAHLERHRQGIAENHDIKFRLKNGSELWAIVSTTSIFDPAGQYVGALAMVTDISDRKQAEAALQKALIAADAANRAKSEFLSKMSHELRTPLNAVLGFTQILNRDVTLNPQQQEYVGIINRAGEHLLALINDVLEMSKIEAGRIELHEHTFDLYQLLNSLEEIFRLKAISKGLQLVFNIAQDVPQFINTDESKLRQVLINLLGNAIKFTEVGKVTLQVKLETAQEDASKPSIRFEVEDTGPGIDPEEVNSLFEAFVQTKTGKQSQSGTGLGLPISRQFVQLMGGQLTLNSSLGQGTTFEFDIKLKPIHINEIQPTKSVQKVIGLEANPSTYRILIVDDLAESRFLLFKLLSPVGFAVRQAVNGEEAVKISQEWQPHLIWMDMQMPILDGYEATQQIKSLAIQSTPIIIGLTASAFDENRTAVLAAGCDDFVSKPFRDDVIFDKMAKHLGLRYLYEDPTPKQSPCCTALKPSDLYELVPADLAVMPKEWIIKLYQAASELDDDLVTHLVEQIQQSYPTLANSILKLATAFRFDKILDLIPQSYIEN